MLVLPMRADFERVAKIYNDTVMLKYRYISVTILIC